MNIKKTSRLSLVEQIAQQIEHLIETNHWRVGDMLPPEPELMKQFDVSRNTLREAIRALVHAGLLETRQGIGTTVKSSSPLGIALDRRIKKSGLLETLEVRLMLEREAAQLAAERRSAQDIENLQTCLENCQEAAKTRKLANFIEMDIEFHKAVVRAAHNHLLIDLYDHITDSLYHSVQDILSLRQPAIYEQEIHMDLFYAIESGNAHEAVQCVNAYMTKFKESLQTKLEE